MKISKLKKVRNLGILLGLVLGWMNMTGQVHATTFINVDFNKSGGTSGTYSGLAAAPDPAGGAAVWNGVIVNGSDPFTSTPNTLVDSSGGIQPGVSFTLGHFLTIDTPSQLGFSTTFANSLLGDFVYDSDNSYAGPTGTFSINGLSNGSQYKLWLYSMTGYPNSDNTAFIFGGVTNLVTGLPTDYSTFSNATATTTGNYVLYSGVVSGGSISGLFTGSNIRFNGFQLEIVPEPSTALLFVSGGLVLWFKRRRNS